jgi:hypothetical protein
VSRRVPMDGATTELAFARDVPSDCGLRQSEAVCKFYTRAAALTTDQRGRSVFEKLAIEESEHSKPLERRYQEMAAQDSVARTASDVSLLQGCGERHFC